jgi:hypothetical protein
MAFRGLMFPEPKSYARDVHGLFPENLCYDSMSLNRNHIDDVLVPALRLVEQNHTKEVSSENLWKKDLMPTNKG